MAEACSEFIELQPNDKFYRVYDCTLETAARKIYDDTADSIAKINVGTGSGSGVFVNDGTEVVTAAHVVDGVTSAIQVVDKSGHVMEARIEKLDDIDDLAVLKLANGERSPHAAGLAASSALKPGEAVYAVGHPLGYSNTVISPGAYQSTKPAQDYVMFPQEGIWPAVLAAEHSADPAVATDAKKYAASARVATTAQIEHGNSGGALFNDAGQIIGITTNGFDNQQQHGTSLSVPVEKVRALLAEPSKFNFHYAEKNYFLLGHVITLTDITRKDGSKRLPFFWDR